MAGGLVERSRETTALEKCLVAARQRVGSTILIEGASGLGKSSLVALARDRAGEGKAAVLCAIGSESERDTRWGLIAQLLEPVGLAAASASRTEEQAERSVVEELFGGLEEIADTFFRDRGSGLLIAIDDLHWADAASLRFLAHLAERIANLPIALVGAFRGAEPMSDARAGSRLRRAAADVLHLAPLSGAGVAYMTGTTFPGADADFGRELARLTAGNTLFVAQILDRLAAEHTVAAPTAAALDDVIHDGVRDSILERLDPLPPPARRVAEGIALLGAGATVRRVGRLTALESPAVLKAADALARVDLLRPELPLRFAQPLTAQVLLGSLPTFDRARRHLSAARIMIDQHGDVEEIARHLLQAPADDDVSAVEPLREAARLALDRDEAEQATLLLERALAENPLPELRVELLIELSQAEARGRNLSPRDRLGEAKRLGVDPQRRARLALANGQALYAHGHFDQAATVTLTAADELGTADPELGGALIATYIAAGSVVHGLASAVLAQREHLLVQLADSPTPFMRAAIAHTVIHDALLGEPRARVRELADLAWGDGALLTTDAALPLSAPLLCAALLLVDELEQALEIADAVRDASPTSTISCVHQTMTCITGWALLLQGNLVAAESEAAAVVDECTNSVVRPLGLILLAALRIECGRLQEAEVLLERASERGIRHPVYDALRLGVRAHLRLAQHLPSEALRDTAEAESALSGVGPDVTPALVPWRSLSAQGHLALDDRERARSLVEDELAFASKLDLPRIVTRDLRILGRIVGGGEGLDTLARAVEIGDRHARRLEHARALVGYGAALRRQNRRTDAREPLRRGLDFSHQGGAAQLESRARAELSAAGARPRRPASTGVSSLTVSQLRVAELAAGGFTTRQIAEALVVTPKTIEYHLSQTYRKLDIASRDELAAVLHKH